MFSAWLSIPKKTSAPGISYAISPVIDGASIEANDPYD